MHILNAHGSNIHPTYECQFRCEIVDQFFELNFEVLSKTNAFYTNEKFTKEGLENWGLWEFDVIELFLSTKCAPPYLELQLSPLNQKFALYINTPRDDFFYPIDWKDFKSSSDYSQNKWSGQIRIDLDKIPQYKKGPLYGNVFAILGEIREYYAFHTNPEQKPDHHRPDLFRELVC